MPCSLAPRLPQMPSKHSFSCLKIICENLGHGIDVRACYVQRVLPLVLSPQCHSRKGPEGFPLDRGLPHRSRYQRGLHRGGQQHRHALPVLQALQPDEEVQLRGESCLSLLLSMQASWLAFDMLVCSRVG